MRWKVENLHTDPYAKTIALSWCTISHVNTIEEFNLGHDSTNEFCKNHDRKVRRTIEQIPGIVGRPSLISEIQIITMSKGMVNIT